MAAAAAMERNARNGKSASALAGWLACFTDAGQRMALTTRLTHSLTHSRPGAFYRYML